MHAIMSSSLTKVLQFLATSSCPRRPHTQLSRVSFCFFVYYNCHLVYIRTTYFSISQICFIPARNKWYAYCLFSNIYEGLVGRVFAQDPRLSFRKSNFTTNRFVVQILVNFFWWNTDCVKVTQENMKMRQLCRIQYQCVRCHIRHAKQCRVTAWPWQTVSRWKPNKDTRDITTNTWLKGLFHRSVYRIKVTLISISPLPTNQNPPYCFLCVWMSVLVSVPERDRKRKRERERVCVCWCV